MEYSYKDIYLLPKYSYLKSRSEADTRIRFGKYKFRIPVMLANMKTVINEELAEWLAINNYFYVMHRFGVDQIEFCKRMEDKGLITSISVGVKDESVKQVEQLANEGITPDFVTIDIAHGHSGNMERMIEVVQKNLKNTFLIVGNVCTGEAVEFLQNLGVKCIKVGVGPGSVCLTKKQTGFSRPQFSAVLECASVAKIPIIADGGIEYNGDITKALVAGAQMVMIGNLAAGFDESPGKKVIYPDGRIVKEYFGSASEYNKKEKEYIEGRKIEIPYRGSIKDKLREIEQSLKSSISYAGGENLNAFLTVKWTTGN